MTTAGGAPCAAAERGAVDVHGVALRYLDWGGSGPPLLFLHGGSAHAHWWDAVIVDLAARYRCIALDLRGHGASGRSADGDYRLETHAADVGAVIEALALHGCGLVGHSFGGWVALLCAAQPAVPLRGLAIVDSRLHLGAHSARLLEALRKLPPPRHATRDEAVARFRLLPAATSAAPEVLAHVARHAVGATADGTWSLTFDRRALAVTGPRDFTPSLLAVRCPVLAVRGARSTVVDADALHAYRNARPDVQLAEVPEAYHHVMLDRPAALAVDLARFFAAALAR